MSDSTVSYASLTCFVSTSLVFLATSPVFCVTSPILHQLHLYFASASPMLCISFTYALREPHFPLVSPSQVSAMDGDVSDESRLVYTLTGDGVATVNSSFSVSDNSGHIHLLRVSLLALLASLLFYMNNKYIYTHTHTRTHTQTYMYICMYMWIYACIYLYIS